MMEGTLNGGQRPPRIREPIAIVAMACRMPGGCRSPLQFWRRLLEGYCASEPIPAERRRLGLDDGDIAGGVRAGFVEEIDHFDAAFFGISPREALHMDPQHRLFLQVAIEALESAGQRWDRLAGSRTGVFLGIYSNEYAWLAGSSAVNIDVHSASGAGPGIAPNRLSYLLDLRGPSLAVDTTCSSSLVAAHLAIASLRRGECDLAITGGTSLMLSSEVMQSVAHSIPIAADGRCKAFSAAADGAVRGEGCVVLVLKRLNDALRDHDPVDAVILGSAVNQDGRSNGLSAPNPEAQAQLISLALQDAGVSASRMMYLEAHGTGTPLGDQIELEAAMQVLAAGTGRNGPCLIGSVKCNVGHLEAAAGAAGLMRAALTLKNGVIAPHPLIGRPHALLERFPEVLALASAPRALSSDPHAVVGVSAFSLGGTNAHLVLGKAPGELRAGQQPSAGVPCGRPSLVPVSARSPDSLERRVRQLDEHLGRPGATESLDDLAYTACERRTRHSYRQTFVARSLPELQREMRNFLSGPASTRRHSASKPGTRVAYVFPGHGCQWPGMAQDLLSREPVFRAVIERLDAVVAAVADWSLMSLLTGETDELRLLSSTYGQPALLAVELGLAELLRSWGLQPAAVIGYSAGETAAMVLAGMVSEADAMRASIRRGRTLEELASAGGLLAVKLSEAETRRVIAEDGDSLALAAIVGPETSIISGHVQRLQRLQRRLDSRDVLCVDSGVPYLFHHPAARDLVKHVSASSPALADPMLPIYSSVVGGRIRHAAEIDAHYWENALCGTLRFSDAISRVLDDGIHVFVEVSPSPVFTTDIRDILHGRNISGRAVPTMRRYGDSQTHLALTLASVFDAGCSVTCTHFLGATRRCVPWPEYPWEPRRFWWPAGPVTRLEREPVVASEVVPAKEPQKPLPGLSIAYEMSWVPSKVPQRARDTEGLPSPADLDAAAKVLAAHPALDEYAAVEPQIEAACALYAAAALRNVGVTLQSACRIEPERLAERLGLDVPRRRLLERLCEILGSDGYLRRESAAWVVAREVPDVDPDLQLALLAKSHPRLTTELSLLARCGPRVGEVLSGRVDPLTLLFPQSDASEAAALFGETGIAVVMNGIAVEAVRSLIAARRSERPLRILEIGAGTGGTTAALRSVLEGRQVSYVFTDISRTLLRYAARRFADWPAMEVRLLDIANDPIAQGFVPRSYDLIVAANVLHATARVRDSIANVQRLLAPAGSLVLIEATRAQRIVDLTFGLTGDWWGYQDMDLRPDHPLLSSDRWHAVLRGGGFQQIRCCPRDAVLAERLQTSVFECNDGSAPERAAQERWLVIEGEEVGVELTRRAKADGQECVLAGLERATQLIAEEPWDGIVDLRCLAVHSHEGWSAPRLMAAQRALCGGLLTIVRALTKRSIQAPPLLLFATRGAIQAGSQDAAPDVVQATLCGCISALAAEHPEWQPRVTDCDAGTPELIAGQIWSEARGEHDFLQVAYREGVRLRPELRRAALEDRTLRPLAPDRSYLVTGGLGAIGFEAAEWLVSLGARHLILAQRSATAPPELAERLAALGPGVQVEVSRVDLTDAAATHTWVSGLRTHSPPIAGVIHTAGSFEDCLLANHDWPLFERVLAPKVVGAWELHRGLADLHLELFALFGSAAELLDPVGMANYVAANAFLQALAARRRSQGLAGTCIAWGGWTDIGMARRRSRTWEKRWEKKGVRGLDTEASFAVLECAIACAPALLFVMDVNWQQFMPAATREQRAVMADSLREVDGPVPGVSAAAVAVADTAFERIMGAAQADRAAVMERLVRKHALAILQLAEHEPLDRDVPLADLGFDSLMSLELRDALAADLAVRLPATLLFDYPALSSLVPFLLGKITEQVSTAAVADEGRRRMSMQRHVN